MIIDFLVKGSSDQAYSVVFNYNGKDLTAKCTCNAGLNFQPCKHIMNILKGDFTNVIEMNNYNHSQIISIKNTKLQQAISELQQAENDMEKHKNQVVMIKKRIEALMYG